MKSFGLYYILNKSGTIERNILNRITHVMMHHVEKCEING